MPDDVRDGFKITKEGMLISNATQNPVLSAEINTLKGQLVGLITSRDVRFETD